jgi:23S rRNA pseudouridine1911/1915/1917 synthase
MKPFDVLYEDNHLLIVNKAPGILVQGDITGDVPLVELAKRYIKERYEKPGEVFLGVVHRIDRPVSGVVILARTSKALERMNALFRTKETNKTYWAVVGTRPAKNEGNLVHWLIKDERKNKATAFEKETIGALRSELNFRIIAENRSQYLLEVNPITGRPHQIRVQLASIGCPIKGDLKYGDDKANPDGSICLHACKISFVHPVKKVMLSITAPMPENGFWKNFSHLQF